MKNKLAAIGIRPGKKRKLPVRTIVDVFGRKVEIKGTVTNLKKEHDKCQLTR